MRSPLFRLMLFACCCIVAACDNGAGSLPDMRTKAFDKGRIVLTADVDKSVSNRPIMLMTSCLPLVSGKGRIGIWGRARLVGARWFLESPLRDTIEAMAHLDSAEFIYIPLDYIANHPVSQSWQIQLEGGISYSFDALAVLDSVYIADSARMYHVNSDVARDYSPGSYGYDRHGQMGSYLNLQPKP